MTRQHTWTLPAPSGRAALFMPPFRHVASLVVVGVAFGLAIGTAGIAAATPDRQGELVPSAVHPAVRASTDGAQGEAAGPRRRGAGAGQERPGRGVPRQFVVTPEIDAEETEAIADRVAEEIDDKGAEEAAEAAAEAAKQEKAKEGDQAAEPALFAKAGGVDLYVPGEVKVIGFHESGSPGAFPMLPIGQATANLNEAKGPMPDASEGPDYMVLPTRYRRGGSTTSVDIAMAPDEPVLSPVTGTVAVAKPYLLYGRTPDLMLEIVPDQAPYARVRIIHLDRMPVQEGSRVVAGETVIAGSARQLPLVSQIDRFAGPGPHAHIEVRDER